jgi:hypothetical protein
MTNLITPDGRADLRRRILNALRRAPGHTANACVLLNTARAAGHRIHREQLAVELAWLAQIAHAVTLGGAGDVLVATLTADGQAVADGALVLPGIAAADGLDNLMGEQENGDA